MKGILLRRDAIVRLCNSRPAQRRIPEKDSIPCPTKTTRFNINLHINLHSPNQVHIVAVTHGLLVQRDGGQFNA